MDNYDLNVDKGAEYIIEKIQETGNEAYLVGGCVRDSIMGRTPNDWDITTNLPPEKVQEIFEKTVPTGIKHGTVTVICGGKGYEVTTYRIDGEYIDMRRPEEVFFSNRLTDDLSRRDFTINAMAYNRKDGLIDRFGGMKDIDRGIVRCVGDPDRRFNEDALRIIRAIRFSAKLDFEIEKETYNSILRNADNLKKVSAERINGELEEIIRYNPAKIHTLNEVGISSWLFDGYIPEMESMDISVKTEQRDGDNYPASLVNCAKRAVLFEGMEEKKLKSLLKKLKYSNDDIKKTLKIHDIITGSYSDEVWEAVDRKDSHRLRCIIKRILRETEDADMAELSLKVLTIKKNANPSLCFHVFNDIIKRGECFSLSQLKVNGKDIIENRIAKGSDVGYLLNSLLDYVIENPQSNEKDILLGLAKTLINSKKRLEV